MGRQMRFLQGQLRSLSFSPQQQAAALCFFSDMSRSFRCSGGFSRLQLLRRNCGEKRYTLRSSPCPVDPDATSTHRAGCPVRRRRMCGPQRARPVVCCGLDGVGSSPSPGRLRRSPPPAGRSALARRATGPPAPDPRHPRLRARRRRGWRGLPLLGGWPATRKGPVVKRSYPGPTVISDWATSTFPPRSSGLQHSPG